MNIDQHFEQVFDSMEVVDDGEEEVVVEYKTNTGERARHAFEIIDEGVVEEDKEAPYKVRAYLRERQGYEFPKVERKKKNTTPQTTLQDYAK